MPILLQAALAALVATATAAFDTVLLRDGGRLQGTVIEETRATGVVILLPDGRTRSFAPAEVLKVEYRDGTVGVVGGAAPPVAPPPPSPPPGLPPEAPPPDAQGAVPPPPRLLAPPPPPVFPPPAPPRRASPSSPGLVMAAAGLGLSVPFGEAEPGLRMADVLRPLALLELEAGLRFTPELMGSLVLDLGVGDAAPRQRAACRASTGSDCTAMALRLAFQLRYAFTPFAPATPWVALGVGGEATGLSSNRSSSSGDVIWSGVEFPRLAVGYDVRSSPTAGWGLFATAGIGRFDQVEDRGVTLDLSRRATHGWLQAGLRVILGP